MILSERLKTDNRVIVVGADMSLKDIVNIFGKTDVCISVMATQRAGGNDKMFRKEGSLKDTLSEIEKVKERYRSQYNKIEPREQRIDMIAKYLREHLGTDINRILNNEIKKLKSIANLIKEYKMGNTVISDTIDAYIVDTFGAEYLDLICGKFWRPTNEGLEVKKSEFLKILNEQWDQFYPDNLGGFDSITDLCKKVNVKNRRTVSKWMQEFFVKKYNEMGLSESDAINLYKKYAKLNQRLAVEKKHRDLNKFMITWDRIEKKVADKGWKIDYSKMNENKFNSIKGDKQKIEIPLICDAKKPHRFTQSVQLILYHDSWCPHCSNELPERLKKIGKNADPPLSLSTLRFFLYNEITVKSEAKTNPSTRERKGTRHRVEVLLSNKDQFRKLIKDKLLLGEEIPDYIDEIVIDFTFHIHPHILDKLFKYYQKSNRFLIIVAYGAVSEQELEDINNEIQKDPRYDYPEHVKVVSLKELAEFFGMDTYKQGIYYKEIESIESLAETTITSDLDFNDLAAKYEKVKVLLKRARKTGDYGLLLDMLNRFLGKKP